MEHGAAGTEYCQRGTAEDIYYAANVYSAEG